MGVLSARVLDGRGSEAYNAGVDAAAHNAPAALKASTPSTRQRRRPPSLAEQRNRTTRIMPWADYWKSLKVSGRWR